MLLDNEEQQFITIRMGSISRTGRENGRNTRIWEAELTQDVLLSILKYMTENIIIVLRQK
jgi:hypothetical protein